MAQTYTRQSTFSDGDTISASLFNDEYNQLVNVFAYSSTDATSTGHRHDGGSGEGGNIPKIGDLDFKNKLEVDSTNNRWGFFVEVSSAAVEQIRIQDGAIVPVTDNDIDLGTSLLEFKDLYLDGTATIDTLTVDEAATIGTTLGVTGATTLSSTLGVTGATTLSSTLGVTGATTLSSTLAVTGTSTLTGNVTTTNDLSVGGNLTVTGNATISGNLTFGDADTDTITIGADVASHITPDVDDTYDLGSATKEWRNLYIDGTAEIDQLNADSVDIASGTIDNTVIGGTTPVAGSFSTLSANSNASVTGNLTVDGNVTLGNASADNLTVNATLSTSLIPTTDNAVDLGSASNEWRNLYIDGVATVDSLTADTVNIDGGTIDNTVIGGTTPVAGSFTTLSTSGQATLATADINGGTIDNATIGGTTAAAGTFSSLVATTADINAGTIDNTAIGSTTASTGNFSTLSIAGTAITSTATELNIVDGSTTATATTLADADRIVVNDAGTMVQVALTDFEVYFESALDTLPNVTTVGALNAGSITSGFGAIDNGSSAITTTGTVTYGSLSDGTITITAFVDEDDMVSNSATLVPTQQSVKAYVDSQVTAQDLDFQGDSGGALSIDLDSETLTIAGGTGIDTTGAINTLTVAIDSTVTTLTGTQTLTNKTLTTPVISTISNTGTLTLPTSTDTLVGQATTDTLTNKTLTSPVINTGVSGTAILDDDTFATASATTLATSESIKAYVDANAGAGTIDGLSDTNITTPADGALLFYDTTTSKWIDNVVSGDITIADTGVAAIGSGVIVNDDINASAAISVSKTALVDGTGLTLTGDTLSVDASQTQITAVGTIATGTWQGTAIANAYVADDLTISGGTVDNTTIGATTPSSGVFTTVSADAVTYDLNSVTSGSTTTLDFTANSSHVVTMTQASTFAFSNVAAGQTGVILIKQDATGGWSFTLPAVAKTPKGGATIVQTTTANTVSVLSYSVLDASNVLVNYIADFA